MMLSGTKHVSFCSDSALKRTSHPPQRSLHPDSLHAGKPVLAGEKWAANLWFRERQTASGDHDGG